MSTVPTVALVHYHLRPGGVTHVLRDCVACAQSAGIRTLVLTGEPPPGDAAEFGSVVCVPELAYTTGWERGDTECLSDAMLSAVRLRLGKEPDIWHVHNPSLGKNLALWPVLQKWAALGRRLLLHIHDFAEDSRPANYRSMQKISARFTPDGDSEILYPIGGRVFYATLTQGDRHRLIRAGTPEKRVVCLPNCVSFFAEEPPSYQSDKDPRTILYPVRGIRRKNLGEFLLWSVLGADDAWKWQISLPAESEQEFCVYTLWKQMADRLRLPVSFEVGLERREGMSQSRSAISGMITTSLKEGFGMVFLEAYAAGLPLIGRELPLATRDLRDQGMTLSGLYPRLGVPLEWINESKFRRELLALMRRMWKDYSQRFDVEYVDRAMDSWVENGLIDFGCLTGALQAAVIMRLWDSKRDRYRVEPEASAFFRFPNPSEVRTNREVASRAYGRSAYRKRLMELYTEMVNAPDIPISWTEADGLVSQFLAPERFRPVLVQSRF